MKSVILFAALVGAVFFLGGCAQLQAAIEAAEAAQEDFEAAGEELRDALEVVDAARLAYEKALDDGDQDAIVAALEGLKAAEAERKERELKFDASKNAVENAQKRLEDAKASGNYIEVLLGTIFGGLFGAGGGFLGGKRSGVKVGAKEAKIEAALSGSTS